MRAVLSIMAGILLAGCVSAPPGSRAGWSFSLVKEIMAKMEVAANNGNGHAKLEIGPLKISGVTATVLTRIVLILGIGYLIAKAHGWL